MNRAFLLTPPGIGAIAVVRIAGPAVDEFLRDHFTKSSLIGSLRHGELRDGDRVLDDPVIVRVNQHTADISLHGGEWVIRSVLDLTARYGFHPAEADLPDSALDGESALEREVLAAVPLARTVEALRLLLAQQAYWATVKANPQRELLERSLANRSLHYHLHPPRVAIVGPPNAGKSTLANQLFGQQRSITADVPGTTRDWVGESANINGLAVTLIDTPGIRRSEDAIEMRAIERARTVIDEADLIVSVIDATQQEEQGPVFPNGIRVLNKVDRAAVSDDGAIETVATTGQGVDALRRAICNRFITSERAATWTQRQREIVQRAIIDPSALMDF